jgi:hypothetical protein
MHEVVRHGSFEFGRPGLEVNTSVAGHEVVAVDIAELGLEVDGERFEIWAGLPKYRTHQKEHHL